MANEVPGAKCQVSGLPDTPHLIPRTPDMTGAAIFFETFFRELVGREIPFAILHGYEGLPGQMPSDIDFVVRCEDLSKLLRIQCKVAARQGWVLVSVVRAKLFALYTVFVNPQEPSQFIQLDACGHYVEDGCFVLRDAEMLRNCRQHWFFNVPAPAIEFAYVLAKGLIKEKPLELDLPDLRALCAADPAGAELFFQRFFGDVSGGLKAWLSQPDEQRQQDLRARLRSRTRLGLVNQLREGARAVERICRPAGLHVVILGPDGAGKSTLISRLGAGPCFRRQQHFHFRPFVFRKNSGPPVTQPHAHPPRPPGMGVAKIFYYFADHWLGYWLRVFPAKIRNELVVFDRSFEDLMVDPRRYRLSRAGSLPRFLRKLLPKPDLLIVLDAEPKQVHSRKPELAIEELRRQREVLSQLAAETPQCVVISAAGTAEQVARLVWQQLVCFLAARERKRHCG